MDRADFSNHRILLVGGKTHTMGLLRSILGIVGITHIFHIEDARRALDQLTMEHFHAIFCDAQSLESDDTNFNFTMAARRREGMLNPMIPLFVLHDGARRTDVEKARDTGVTDILTTPVSPRTIMTKLRTAQLAPRPFIVAAEFFGPDRRSKNRAPWAGDERRSRVAKKTKIDFNHI